MGTVAIAAFVIAASRHARRIADRRVAHLKGRGIAYYLFLRIPLGTAVVEEDLFRRVLLAMWRAVVASQIIAASCAAVAFGPWHMATTVAAVRINEADAPAKRVRSALAGAVVIDVGIGVELSRRFPP